jgi:L-threonylcarbamoyladenylate synthase
MSRDRLTHRYTLDQLDAAAASLRSGGIVAFPTETVYGLGANALDEKAISRVFEAKGRPQDNPLIVHIADEAMLDQVVQSTSDIARRLIQRHWPGPLTLLFPKSDRIPSSVTAGLATVAVRMPEDRVARELIRLAGVPIVAPSANQSGHPSATTWQAVIEDLDGRIDGVVCGPSTRIGLESTVLDCVHAPARILRHGAIDMQTLRESVPDLIDACGQPIASDSEPAPSPGMKHRHYQPRAQVRIVHHPLEVPLGSDNTSAQTARRGWIGISTPKAPQTYALVVQCSSMDEYASRLFEAFRAMDRAGIEIIECEAVGDTGIGRAIMDRLSRASQTITS